MPLHKLEIGGHIFEVICQEGEEDFLNAAAKYLDDEANVFIENQGRIGESRMLLMSGLMLADRMGGIEDKLAKLEAEVQQRELALEDKRKSQIAEETKALEAQLADKDAELSGLKREIEDVREALATSEGKRAELDEALIAAQRSADQATSAEPIRVTENPVDTPPEAPEPVSTAQSTKVIEELEHKTAQVKNLTARLMDMNEKLPADDKPRPDPFDMAMMEAERDEAEALATAAKNELARAQLDLEKVTAELKTLKEERTALSKAEVTARDELEAEISAKAKKIEELEALVNREDATAELQEKLDAAERTIDKMVATAEAAAAEFIKDDPS
ncbi:MAG: cell division protein ZapA [Pseudomonadota bacterium]